MIPLSWYLVVSAVLFTIGVVGIFFRRDLITLFMCIELQLNGVNLALIAFSRYLPDISGQIIVFFVITVAAAEAAVGLAIMIALFHHKEHLDSERVNLMQG
ncbi:MAG: NADH-quinone oxidoreductase subunit NuoK [Acidobacteria bacterium]|nr:NADH-quinone oxidoreductase subunit NuoK [Acidobacteriota bacterium]